MSVINWLLDSDPSIRWQVMRDLTGESDATVARERSRVASEGWGARLLDLQGPDGHWGGAAFVPRAWISTKDTLQLLRDLGVDPTSRSRATGHRAGEGPLHVGTGVRRLAVLRGRDRAVHQRTRARDRCVLRRSQRSARRAAARGTAGGRRLELRCPAQSLVASAGLDAVVVPFDHLCARRIAGIRDGYGAEARSHRRTPSRTGVPPRAAPVSIAVHRTGHQSCVDADFGSPHAGTTTFCGGWTICGKPASNPTIAPPRPSI